MDTTTLVLNREAVCTPLVKPEPRSPISIRAAVGTATGADFKFIDALQKKHSKMVGFARTSEIEGHIKAQRVLIAEDELNRPIGYCIYKDKYMGREDCGNIVQLNVEPHKHRGLMGAELIKTVFQRVPYGVRLFCCWCAQDLAANHFWEAMGFVPLAFRTGARGKAQGGSRKETRMHIFWECRIREGDNESPYWYPTETNNGPMKEARIALPIPPGTHWSDAKPTVLPGAPTMERLNDTPAAGLEGDTGGRKEKKPRTPKAALTARPKHVPRGGLWFAPPVPPPPSPEEIKAAKAAEPKPKRERQKNDPKLVAMARELRDRYLEEVNNDRLLPAANGKYDVSRQLEAAPSATQVAPIAMLEAA